MFYFWFICHGIHYDKGEEKGPASNSFAWLIRKKSSVASYAYVYGIIETQKEMGSLEGKGGLQSRIVTMTLLIRMVFMVRGELKG